MRSAADETGMPKVIGAYPPRVLGALISERFSGAEFPSDNAQDHWRGRLLQFRKEEICMGVELVSEQPRSRPMTDLASEVIDFLNGKTGRRFPSRNPRGSPTANAEIVMHRLKEGYTVQDCKQVIASKCREWLHDEKMSRYLTPDTLFRRSNFERYLGQLGD